MKIGRKYFLEVQLNRNDYRTVGILSMPEQSIADMRKRHFLTIFLYWRQVVIILGWPRKLRSTGM